MSGAFVKHVDIGGQQYTLTAKFGTMRLAEREIGEPIPTLMDEGRIGLDAISALFWAFLQPKHRMTREAADNLVDEASHTAVVGWVKECVIAFFGGGEPTENPTPAKGKKAVQPDS